MKKREMQITIGPDGEVSIEVIGVAGKECVDVSEFLEEALGEVSDRQYTREYYQQPASTNEQVKVGGE
jgi:hypothetical protein